MSSPEPDAVPLAIVVGAGGSFGTEIVAALVEAGARTDIADHAGRRPGDLAPPS